MPVASPSTRAVTAGGLFHEAYKRGADLMEDLRLLRRGIDVDIPRTNLQLAFAAWFQERGLTEVASNHVNVNHDSRGKIPLLSVTHVYHPSVSSHPLSIGAYRGREFPPDYFIKQDPNTWLVVCRLGSAGLRGGEPAYDEPFGETAVSQEARLAELPPEDAERLRTVANVLAARMTALETVVAARQSGMGAVAFPVEPIR